MALDPDLASPPADQEAFAAACAEHWGHLYHLARDVLRDDGDAEDAVLDTLEVAWRSRRTLRDPEALGPWLTRICLRRALRLRLRIRHRQLAELSRLDPPDAAPDPDPRLDAAVSRLSPRQRAVIRLHYGDGHTLDACAGLLGCRPGTVRRHLGRALATLRRELGR